MKVVTCFAAHVDGFRTRDRLSQIANALPSVGVKLSVRWQWVLCVRKSRKTLCENCGCISLIAVSAKISCVLHCIQFRAVLDHRTRSNQGGFWSKGFCVNQTSTLCRMLTGKSPEASSAARSLFVDFSQCFCFFEYWFPWELMEAGRTRPKLKRILWRYYAFTTVRV